MDDGGEWENEVWADHYSERRIKLRFQEVRARPWILERRSGLARGIYYRLVSDDRFPGKQIPPGVRRCLSAFISGGGYAAY